MKTKKKPQKSKTIAERLGDKLAYTCAEVGGFLGVSPSTIRRWVNSGRLPALDIPGDKRISRATVERLLGDPAPSAN